MKTHRRSILTLLFTALVTISLAGCQSSPTQQDTGRVIGAVLGGVLGSNVGKGSGKTAAIIAGTILGGYLGGKVGKSMDDSDRVHANQTFETTPTNQTSSWRNPDSGNEYSVTPTSTYTKNDGPCRDYTTDVVIDGRRETATGTACREDGKWRVVN